MVFHRRNLFVYGSSLPFQAAAGSVAGSLFVTELFLVEGYLAFRVSRGRSPAVYRLVLFLSILPLILSKLAGFWDGSTFAFLGISYLTFRCVQIIIETYDGLITEMPVLDFAAFVLFFRP